MMARAGAFPPAMAAHLIREFSEDGDLVLDPFCGKGTSVLEAVLAGRSAIGSDIAPDAVACTRAKVAGVSFDDVDEYVDTLKYRRYSLSRVPDDVRVFYHDLTLSRTLSVRDRLASDLNAGDLDVRRLAAFVLGSLLGILHGHATYSLSLSCSHVFAMAPSYVRKYAAEKNLRRPVRDVRECLRAKSRLLLSGPAVPPGRAQVHQSAADEYSYDHGSLAGRVALILTSPPYLNAQTYAKDAWLRLWFLEA
jgi:site-specific DNA-methyltransferase (adenine-specific)